MFVPDAVLPAAGRLVVYEVAGGATTAADAVAIGLPPGDAATVTTAVLTDVGPALREVPARAVPVALGVPALLAVDTTALPAYQRPADSVRAWAVATRLALRLVAAQRLLPDLVAGEAGRVTARWRALVDDDPEVAAAIGRLAAALPPAAHAGAVLAAAAPAVARSDALVPDPTNVQDPKTLLRAYADAVADTAVRAGGPPPRAGRPRERLLPWTARWAEALADPADPVVPLRAGDAAELPAGVAAWHSAGDDAGAITELRLHAPSTAAAAGAPEAELEALAAPWTLAVGVRDADGDLVPAADVWAGADADTARLQEVLLAGLGRAARVFAPLDAALQEAELTAIELDVSQAWSFVSEVEPLLRGSDVVVVLPPELAVDEIRLRLRVGAAEAAASLQDGATPAAETLSGETTYRWEVTVGDETLAGPELDSLLDAGTPLVRWRDRWLRLDPAAVERLRSRAGTQGTMGLADAVTAGLAGSLGPLDLPDESPASEDTTAGQAAEQPVEVVTDGTVARLLDRLADAGDRPAIRSEPPGFVGTLRGYQRRGVAWLGAMADLGLGAVLADEMGLGKTVSLIAHVLSIAGDRPSLVVCPTSVVGNWERELGRFAPDVPVTRWHGPERSNDLAGVKGVVLTSYGTLRRDLAPLLDVEWQVLALDEAQHIKNPQTTGAKAVRRLRRLQTVALTGTPLENRLAELWALLDVTNPGLLGTRGRFGRRFVTPIERRHDRRTASRLRRLVAPFVLRREKADPAVGVDLPPKIERTVAAPLTREQAELYAAAVERVLGDDDGAVTAGSVMERRGRVLALLTELKQICNHPAQALRQDGPLPGRSGKLAVAREIVGEATRAGERVLVFTQYVVMGRLLVAQFGADLGVDVPLLHGGLRARERDQLVARFQAGEEGWTGDAGEPAAGGTSPSAGSADGDVPPPVLVVSLRAGGSGLNLTAATHVLHYDRWWNPAVEDQATDRAHRIGQRRTVEVHKLVAAGTVEERIDALIDRKRALADQIVGAGEAWITELGDAELRELVALAPGAGTDDLDDEWEREMAGSG